LGVLLNMQSAMVLAVNLYKHERTGIRLCACGNGHVARLQTSSTLSALY